MSNLRSAQPIFEADALHLRPPRLVDINPADDTTALTVQPYMHLASSQPQHPMHFIGFVETTTDALRLIMAARQGLIPRITRRLNDSERRSMIKSGAVFVFSVEESGIKRWTEGLAWSPSRIVGNFLVYREVTERSVRGIPEKSAYTPGTSSFHATPSSRRREIGKNSDSSALRTNGLIKKTITVKIDGTDHHLISYYRDEDVRSGRLPRPTMRPDIMALAIPPEMVRGTNFRHPPHVEIGPDGRAHIYDAEEADVRRQKSQSSSPPALSRTFQQPSLSIDTLSHPSSGNTSPALPSPPGSSIMDYDPASSYRPHHGVSVARADRNTSYGTRTSPSWSEQRLYHQHTAPMTGLVTYDGRDYYSSALPERSQTPGSFPALLANPLPLGSQTNGASLERPTNDPSWSPPPSFSNGTQSAHYYHEPGDITASKTSSAGSSPGYSRSDQSHTSPQSPSSYPPHRALPRYGAENPLFSRGPPWSFESDQGA